MRRTIPSLVFCAAVAGGTASAWADDTYVPPTPPDVTINNSNTTQEPGTVAPEGRTTGRASEMTHGYLEDEVVGIKPQIGVLVFKNPLTQENDSRAAYGLTLDWNLATTVNSDWKSVFLGPSTGLIFSHLGANGANFFGTGDNGGSSNLFYIPANLKLGYNFARDFRIALHGGGNVIYRSLVSSINSGPGTDLTSNWSLYPNVGGDVEFGFGASHAELMLRPDVTLTPGDAFFTGTVALGIPIG